MGKRFRNYNWDLPTAANGTSAESWDVVKIACLMDIRDELQAMRTALIPLRHLECANFQMIPAKLDAIRRNTRKPRPAKKRAKP